MKIFLPPNVTLPDLECLKCRRLKSFQEVKNRRLSKMITDPLAEPTEKLRQLTMSEMQAEIDRSIAMVRVSILEKEDLLPVLDSLEDLCAKLREQYLLTMVSVHALSFMTDEQIEKTLKAYQEKVRAPEVAWIFPGKEGKCLTQYFLGS